MAGFILLALLATSSALQLQEERADLNITSAFKSRFEEEEKTAPPPIGRIGSWDDSRNDMVKKFNEVMGKMISIGTDELAAKGDRRVAIGSRMRNIVLKPSPELTKAAANMVKTGQRMGRTAKVVSTLASVVLPLGNKYLDARSHRDKILKHREMMKHRARMWSPPPGAASSPSPGFLNPGFSGVLGGVLGTSGLMFPNSKFDESKFDGPKFDDSKFGDSDSVSPIDDSLFTPEAMEKMMGEVGSGLTWSPFSPLMVMGLGYRMVIAEAKEDEESGQIDLVGLVDKPDIAGVSLLSEDPGIIDMEREVLDFEQFCCAQMFTAETVELAAGTISVCETYLEEVDDTGEDDVRDRIENCICNLKNLNEIPLFLPFPILTIPCVDSELGLDPKSSDD